jgi:hypothetical protein
MPPTIWRGVNPTTRTGVRSARTNIESLLGRPLTEADRANVEGAVGRPLLSWDDELTGSEYNNLLQKGASLTGGTWEPWKDPAPTGPPPAAPPPPTSTNKTWSWDAIPDAPEFKGPGDFKYDDFEAPGAEGMYADPGYKWRLEQGQKAIEASKAANGRFLSGETLRDLMTYGQGMASQEYGNVFNRATTAYGLNRNNAADMWDRALQVDQLEYAPELATWNTRVGAQLQREGLSFDRDWQEKVFNTDNTFREKQFETDDAWRKEVYRNDDAFRKAVFASDDEFRRAVENAKQAWQKELLIEERLRFLASMGR